MNKKRGISKQKTFQVYDGQSVQQWRISFGRKHNLIFAGLNSEESSLRELNSVSLQMATTKF